MKYTKKQAQEILANKYPVKLFPEHEVNITTKLLEDVGIIDRWIDLDDNSGQFAINENSADKALIKDGIFYLTEMGLEYLIKCIDAEVAEYNAEVDYINWLSLQERE